jgi:hypothetical protein
LSSIPTIWTGRMGSLSASHGNLSSAPWEIAWSLQHMTVDLGSLRGHTGCALPLSGQAQTMASGHSLASTLMSWLPSATSSPTACLKLTHLTSLPYMSVPCPTHPYTSLPHLFPRPEKLPPFRVSPNSCYCLLSVRSVVVWEPSSFILFRGCSNGNWGSLFHFPAASYII